MTGLQWHRDNYVADYACPTLTLLNDLVLTSVNANVRMNGYNTLSFIRNGVDHE